MRHGTPGMYTHAGCRCEPCRTAMRDYRLALSVKNECGIYTTYNLGCRCDECSEAHRAWRIARDERTLAEAEAGVPMKYEHGTYTAYTLGLCRCEECRAAARVLLNGWVAERRKDRENGVPLPDHIEHGTRYAYNKYVCRCDECRAANAEHGRAYRRNECKPLKLIDRVRKTATD